MIQYLSEVELAKNLSLYGASIYFIIQGDYNRLYLNAGKFTEFLSNQPGKIYMCNNIQELLELRMLCSNNNALMRVFIDGKETK